MQADHRQHNPSQPCERPACWLTAGRSSRARTCGRRPVREKPAVAPHPPATRGVAPWARYRCRHRGGQRQALTTVDGRTWTRPATPALGPQVGVLPVRHSI